MADQYEAVGGGSLSIDIFAGSFDFVDDRAKRRMPLPARTMQFRQRDVGFSWVQRLKHFLKMSGDWLMIN